MAAMFQAQTQNWEETQEKMSQLVSPFSAFCPCSSSESNEQCLFSSYAVLSIARSVYIAVEVPVLVEAENHINHTKQLTSRSLFHRATFAIDVDRKVRTFE